MSKRICSNPLSWIAILLICSSCSVRPEDAIIGKWGDPNKPSEGSHQYFKDGTFSITPPASAMPKPSEQDTPGKKLGDTMIKVMLQNVSGTYTFIDKDRIKMTVNGLMGMAGPIVFKISISGDEMFVYEIEMAQGVDKVEPPMHLHRLR